MEQWPEVVAVRSECSDQGSQCSVSKLFTIWYSVSDSKMPCLCQFLHLEFPDFQGNKTHLENVCLHPFSKS